MRYEAHPGERLFGLLVYVTPAVDYHGPVLDPADKPVADALVTILGGASGDAWTTRSDGRFAMQAPGRCRARGDA